VTISRAHRLALAVVTAGIVAPIALAAVRAEGRTRHRQRVTAQDSGWTMARPDYRWSFPRDHWSHPGYRTEWWYFTGQLAAAGDTAPRFGYQFTLFRVGLAPRPAPWRSDWRSDDLVMGHAALTDLRAGTHRFSETLVRRGLLGDFGAPPDTLLGWARGPAGTAGPWTLRWNGRGFAFTMADARRGFALDLTTEPLRPLTLQGPNGFSRKGDDPTNASQYYSFTRLATGGAIVVDGDTLRVTGTSWMDKEFGSNQLAPGVAGWDWFSLQLADGRDLMLYLLRDTAGTAAWRAGTLVPARGAARYLGAAEYRVDVTGRWSSPASRARYPARWTVTVPSASLVLDVVPLVADQENRSAIAPRLFYWEGAVLVRDGRGRPVGRGYVELTGYGGAMKPAI
jgi:predicted secreted hydrolase